MLFLRHILDQQRKPAGKIWAHQVKYLDGQLGYLPVQHCPYLQIPPGAPLAKGPGLLPILRVDQALRLQIRQIVWNLSFNGQSIIVN